MTCWQKALDDDAKGPSNRNSTRAHNELLKCGNPNPCCDQCMFGQVTTYSVSDNSRTSDIFRSILQLVWPIVRMCGNHVRAQYLLSKSTANCAQVC